MFQLFRSFLPLHNPIGFGTSDFIELALAALLVLLIVAHAGLGGWARRLAARTGWCMLALAILPIALRLAMLAQSPAPTPNGSDDFSHLLVAPTLRHFRPANPPHPPHPLFGHPWAGVALSVAALCALCYWMLRAWTTPGWALVGGLLAVIQFGPLRYWMNTYWGGAVSAVAGCLVFGSLPRLRASWRTRDAVFLGLGIGIQLLTRPFECVLLAVAVILFFLPALRLPKDWRKLARVTAAATLTVTRASDSGGDSYCLAGCRIDRAPKQTSHWQLDDASIYAQPVSVRRAHHLHGAAESGAAQGAHCQSAAQL